MPTIHEHRLDAAADRDFLRDAPQDPFTGVAFRPTNTVVVASDGTVLLRQSWDALDGRYRGSSETLPWAAFRRDGARSGGDGATGRAGRVAVHSGASRRLPDGAGMPPRNEPDYDDPPPKRTWLWALLAVVGIALAAIGGLFLADRLGGGEPPVVEETDPTPTDTPEFAPLAVGETEGTLGDGDVRGPDGRYQDRYQFEADSTGRILAFTVLSEDFLPDLVVTGPDGRQYGGETLGNDAERVGVRNLSGPGTYEVIVTSREPLGEGAYTLRLRQESPVQALRADGQTVRAVLGERSELTDGFWRDTYTFRAEAEREYTLTLASSAFTIVPRLTAGGSRPAVDDRATGTGRVLKFTPSETRTYRLTVTSDKRNARGAYTLTLAAGPRPERPDRDDTASSSSSALVANGPAASDSLGTGETRTYTFRGGVGDQIRVDARADGFSPRLVLIGPDGRRLAADPETDRASLRTTLVSAGTYRVQVGAGEGGGLLRLSLEKQEAQTGADIPRVPIPNAPTPTPPPTQETPTEGGENYQPQPLGDQAPDEQAPAN